MVRKDFLMKSSLFGLGVLIFPQLISCKDKLQLEQIIGQNEEILSAYKKTGDGKLAFYQLPVSSFKIDNVDADGATAVVANGVITGFRTSYLNTDKFKSTKANLEDVLGKANNGYNNEFGQSQVWIKNGLKYELSETYQTDLLKAYLFYSINKLNDKLIYF